MSNSKDFKNHPDKPIFTMSDSLQEEYKSQSEELAIEEKQNAKNARFCAYLFSFLIVFAIGLTFYLKWTNGK